MLWTSCLCVVGGWCRPPMLCVAQNHRLQAHRHCFLTWIFCVKWNMRDVTWTFRTQQEMHQFLASTPSLKCSGHWQGSQCSQQSPFLRSWQKKSPNHIVSTPFVDASTLTTPTQSGYQLLLGAPSEGPWKSGKNSYVNFFCQRNFPTLKTSKTATGAMPRDFWMHISTELVEKIDCGKFQVIMMSRRPFKEPALSQD